MNKDVSKSSDTRGSLDPVDHLSEPKKPRGVRLLWGGIVLVLFVLAGTLAVVLLLTTSHPSAHASGGAPTPTPTIPSGTPTPVPPRPYGSLYLATPGSVARLHLHSDQVAWSVSASAPSTPIVVGQTLFFENMDPTNSFLEAVNVQTGAVLWSNSQEPTGFLLASEGEVYDSYCNMNVTSDPCHLDGLNALTGALLWSYDLPNGNAWIALQHGVLYGVSYGNYFALNAITGVPLWQQTLANYQEAAATPAINEGVLAFSTCDTNKLTPDYGSCDLVATNASTGAVLWQQAVTSPITTTPSIQLGVVYAGDANGTLEALNALNGTVLWSTNVGTAIGQVQASAGTLYVQTFGANGLTSYRSGGGPSFFLGAYSITTHALLWSLMSNVGQIQSTTIPLASHTSLSGGGLVYPFVLVDGLLYLPNGSATAVVVLKGHTGSVITEYMVPGGTTLSGFTVTAV